MSECELAKRIHLSIRHSALTRGAAFGSLSAGLFATTLDRSRHRRHASLVSVLSDRTIRDELKKGRIVIDPFDDSAVQPASVDLRLSGSFRVFRGTSKPFIDVRQPVDDLTELIQISAEEPFVIQPGTFFLGSTLETITLPDDIVGRVDGKSSLGRLGLLVHATAGYVDPGWTGTLTLELSNQSQMPIALYLGMRIAQISFQRLSTAVDRPYGSPELGSKYQGQTGPTPSRISEEFRSGPDTPPR
ncbi:MAG: dCTP deaminase [Chloroflexi bacterium]|nr:dCTP deaminase [Chloroflexota bacterium]MCH7953373.1 dCTP deaminase [Chloroflexota bacterium]MCI0783071.1 dCTP deaminase [Chloroflexota bacterium]MCI0814702.1 dCTP deaminase [Chloroflexota bacterium]MCI0816813.1 dCTP deaminase [Chloroflexota bacterium]